jgi:hypothetical protein
MTADDAIRIAPTELGDEQLTLAARHVRIEKQIVARQRERIARLRSLGCSTSEHEM